jgi:cell division septation protein DedD
MREKIFYVINLDKNRISLLSLLLLGLLFSFFFLGVSIGKGKNQLAKNSTQSEIKELQANNGNGNIQSPETSKNPENTLISNPTEPNASSVANLDSSIKGNLEATTNPSEQALKNSNEPIALANRPPDLKNSNAEATNVVDLQSNTQVSNYPTENTDRQETLYKSKTIPKLAINKKSPKKSVSPSGVSYSIQLAAFTQKSMAETFIKKLKADNPKLKERVFIKKANHHFLVRMGSDSNKESLRNLLSKLRLDSNIRKHAILVKNS